MRAFKNKKVITVLTIITTLITLISASFNYFLRMYVSYRFNIDSNKAALIGIIGGSDGPTSIFIAGMPSSSSITIIFALLSIIGFVYLISMKKFQK
jgi:Na+-transporting methylmalonyl-CoA/oxaloacetate decarboxylase beta subunit